MASFNKCILVGALTRDVDLKYTGSGTPVTEIGLAVNDRVKKNNEWVDEVTYVDVTLWGRTAEIAGEWLQKGSPVLIEGRLKLDQWEQDGQKRSKLRVTCERMQMLGTKGDGNQGQRRDSRPSQSSYVRKAEQAVGGRAEPASMDSFGDDVPF